MSTAQSQPSDAVDRVLHGRYRLVRPIATGGMAEVWEGHDDVLARSVAVKMLLPRLAADEAVRERFRREAIAAARLSHPYVVAIFDTGLEGEQPFIVMELVAGKTLRQRMDAGPLRTGMAVAITDQVAQGLSHAHAAGLVHRDIKPGNILLADDPGGLHVKVTDFGIARATVEDAHLGDTDLTDPGTVMGTMKYIAPELVEGGAADARSDVFSLGVVLYEMLTGRVPFEGATPLANPVARLESGPPRPRKVRAGVSRFLDAITMRRL
ncbi:MAG: protein kinase domain-containing protein, partial [Acidimicrobiales bacterium]